MKIGASAAVVLAFILTLCAACYAFEAKTINRAEQNPMLIPNPYTLPSSWEAVKQRVKIANPDMLINHPAFKFVVANPDLPNVLIIGDSISIGYTETVRRLLQNKANVYRIPTNGGWTTRGINELSQWLQGVDWQVIHFNWGLHDLKRHNPLVETGEDDRQGNELIHAKFHVPPERYRQNLHQLAAKLKATNAELIWATTTPIPPASFNRISGDELSYNAIALGVMELHQIAVNDLHSAIAPYLTKYQRPNDVHFTPEGDTFLGTEVYNNIIKKLAY